jgi:hypothetical protein
VVHRDTEELLQDIRRGPGRVLGNKRDVETLTHTERDSLGAVA